MPIVCGSAQQPAPGSFPTRSVEELNAVVDIVPLPLTIELLVALSAVAVIDPATFSFDPITLTLPVMEIAPVSWIPFPPVTDTLPAPLIVPEIVVT